MIGINNDLDGVANVIEPPVCIISEGVREVVARRVRILHPKQAPIADNKVGIAVKAEERSNRCHALLDGPTEHDPALGGDVAADQNVGISEIPREERSSSRTAHWDPTDAAVWRINVVFAL